MMKGNKIPAKLLLAGEFTVLTGGEALGIPFPKFFGQWAYGKTVDERLENLFQYLASKKIDFLDIESFLKDINSGLLFESNIPEGYGLGGSGALSAAVLQEYGLNATSDIKLIQQQLAMIESCFHGTSSGFDPLISYFQRGCLVQNKNTRLLPETNPVYEKLVTNLYLIDSNSERINTSPIQWFYEQINSLPFQTKIEELNGINSLFIRNVLEVDQPDMSPLFQKISSLQFELFQPLIVPTMRKIWEAGLEQGTYFCKLCGKGSGGFYYVWLNGADSEILHQDFPDLSFISIR
ncbi:MAG: hypothetical protein ABI761_08050 [Saprospiraceae bacterium]